MQRGQTCCGFVRYTSDRSRIGVAWPFDVASNVPFLTSAVPWIVVSRYRLMTHTGTLDAKSGRGAPKVVPFGVPAPVAPVAWQTEFVLASQPDRQKERLLLATTGKFCEMPVTP